MGLFNVIKLANDYNKAKKFIEANKQDVEKAKKLIDSIKNFIDYLKGMRTELDELIATAKVRVMTLKEMIRKDK